MTEDIKKYVVIAEKFSTLFAKKNELLIRCSGLGRIECKLLHILREYKSPISMNKLAIKLNVSNGRVTHLIDHLKKKELVTKYHSHKDRRYWFVKITPNGIKSVENSDKENLRIQQNIIQRIPKEKIELLFDYLNLYLETCNTVIAERENNGK